MHLDELRHDPVHARSTVSSRAAADLLPSRATAECAMMHLSQGDRRHLRHLGEQQ